MRPTQIGHHSVNDDYKAKFVWNHGIWFWMSLNYSRREINYKSALIQVMFSHITGGQTSLEPMTAS